MFFIPKILIKCVEIRILLQKSFQPMVVTINQVVGFSRICGGLMGSARYANHHNLLSLLYFKEPAKGMVFLDKNLPIETFTREMVF